MKYDKLLHCKIALYITVLFTALVLVQGIITWPLIVFLVSSEKILFLRTSRRVVFKHNYSWIKLEQVDVCQHELAHLNKSSGVSQIQSSTEFPLCVYMDNFSLLSDKRGHTEGRGDCNLLTWLVKLWYSLVQVFEVFTRSFWLVMKPSKFYTDASHLTFLCKCDHQRGDWVYSPIFYNAFSQSAQSAETLQTLYSTQTRRDDCCLWALLIYYFFFLLSVFGE